jgi:NADH pyrophosphatase NudC (nudix superfamily)
VEKRIHASLLHLYRNYLQFFPMSAFKCTVFLFGVFVSSISQVRMASGDSSVYWCCAVFVVMVPDVSKDRSAIIFRGLLHLITPNNRTLESLATLLWEPQNSHGFCLLCLHMLQTTTIALSTIVHHLQERHFPATCIASLFLALLNRQMSLKSQARHDSSNYNAVLNSLGYFP